MGQPQGEEGHVLILHKLFGDSYTIWQIFGGGAAFIESLDYAFLDRDYYNDARIGRHDIAMPAAGGALLNPQELAIVQKLLHPGGIYERRVPADFFETAP